VLFTNELCADANTISAWRLEEAVETEFGLRLFLFQSIETAWDNNSVYEVSASDDELIYNARKQRSEPARQGRLQANNGQSRSLLPPSNFDSSRWTSFD
jgi:hypothetical protein